MTRLRVHPAADREATSATNWYRERSEEAAIDLTRTLREDLQAIRQRPAAWPEWQRSAVRRKVLRRFPYSVFFLVEHDGVVLGSPGIQVDARLVTTLPDRRGSKSTPVL